MLWFDLQKTEHDWQNYVEKSDRASIGMKNGCYWPSGKTLGGSSSINAMMYVRGNKRDYDQWEEMGNPTWDYENVLKYFKKSEGNKEEWITDEDEGKYHGTDGPLAVSSYRDSTPIKSVVYGAANELKYASIIDINANETLGFTTTFGTLENGKRASVAKAFLFPAKDRPNLTVIKHAFVTKIAINGKGEAEAVNFSVNGKDITAKAGKEIILSAGAVNTPKILMLSGIGPEDHLKELGIEVIKNLPVGKNLEDHMMVPYIFSFHKSIAEVASARENMDMLYMYMRSRIGAYGTIGATDFTGFVNTLNNTEGEFPDIQYTYFYFNKQSAALLKSIETIGYNDEISESITKIGKESNILFTDIVLLNPKSSGKIELRSNDPFDKPKIFANYLDEQEDMDTVLRGIRLKQKFLATDSYKQNEAEEVRVNIPGCTQLEYDSDEYWYCYIRHMSSTMYHPTGTAKMGPISDKSTVVDSRLRVKGIKGLRVADASIMPKIVSGNTNAPTIMIGEKAADFIKEDWADSVKHTEL